VPIMHHALVGAWPCWPGSARAILADGMFESAELGHLVEEPDYEREVPALRAPPPIRTTCPIA